MSYLKQIMLMHKCTHKQNTKDHQCFMVTEDDDAPSELIGKCLRISNEIQGAWGAQVVRHYMYDLHWLILLQGLKYGVEDVPAVYRKQIIAAEIRRREKEGQVFQAVAPKQRGMGNKPAPTPFDPTQSSNPLFGSSTPSMFQWGAPYAPIILQSSVLDSPTKRALGIPPVAPPNQTIDLSDTPLEEWLNDLDKKNPIGNTIYSELWPTLSISGYETVQDIILASEETLANDAACNNVVARRIQAKARSYLTKK